MVSRTQLPVARQMTSMPSTPGSLLQPFPYVENPNLSGQAMPRGQRPPPPASAPALSAPAAGTTMSRTTLWRKRKAAEFLAQEQGLPRSQQPAQKEYTCSPEKKSLGTPGWAASTYVPWQRKRH
ncbi:hypothetical protein ABG768_021755 [Culter alburnus]|uniref:Uncharacterized protein n=1 Tax=Culter alburnus TaxID=194366 RepID=A0AAW2AS18_CULAL